MDDTPPLRRLADELSRPDTVYLDPTRYARLSVVEQASGLSVDFYGSPLEAPYLKVCLALRSPGTAERLVSVVLRSPDEGANGIRNWDLTELLDTPSTFSNLKLFSIAQTSPGDHNKSIVASSYDEDGVLGRLLHKAPVLDALIAPSAPNDEFFKRQGHPLRYLNLDTGLATQGFIGNLADSKAFPGLRTLEFGEFDATDDKDFNERCTPLEDYRRLFSSTAFEQVQGFTWRNPACSATEVATLRRLLPHRFSFKVIRTSSEYVRLD
ncbi:MAG: hypothetical protein EOP37_10750 [Rubrivivax sp.]|nr:MAG: hypothetical protein EOP37_10750 [Rubrivivax sp.]